MAKVTNAFIKSKMNQDLDARLLPNGEYREGLNIQVSKSEGPDVGALENVLGNILLGNVDLKSITGIDSIKVIGHYVDKSTDTVFLFLTDYTDEVFADSKVNFKYEPTASNFIYSFNVTTHTLIKLVEGAFLNFSTTHPIIGVNVLENLLFFTDNRNQPRKINISLANPDPQNTSPTYYTNEDNISIAKYNPYEAIQLYKDQDIINAIGTTMIDATSEYLPNNTVDNPYYDENYAGDPDFLKDKFVRFSYRFKFNDGEYSLLAPFTQEAFIPEQDGYFLGTAEDSSSNPIPFTSADEQDTYRSSTVSFMENKANEIELLIPLPSEQIEYIDNVAKFNGLKVLELDIIYKESGGLAVQVVDTITIEEINSKMFSTVLAESYNSRGENQAELQWFYPYKYQGRKPYKTLPEAELIRVYDKVPVRAFSQEVSGNRVIYGNFQDKHTPPVHLNYNVAVSDKYPLSVSEAGVPKNRSGYRTSSVEYPMHTVKQNRNYQVGVVLSDRFGRSSTVVLSSVNQPDDVLGKFYGSTTYHPYFDKNRYDNDKVADWAGDSIKMVFNDQIGPVNPSYRTGWPGIYNGNPDDANYNPLGWYSYKIVVKQTEQEYYNVYTGGIIEGDPNAATTAGNPIGTTSTVSLISDNINKVPKDVTDIGPEQKQFRSEVTLFPRVTPNYDATGSGVYPTFNEPFFPTSKGADVPALAEYRDIFLDNSGSPIDPLADIYESTTNPLVARLSTSKAGEAYSSTILGSYPKKQNTYPYFLGVLETNPVVSRLEIFWETSTTGLVNDLNYLVANSENDVAIGLENFSFNLREDDVIGTVVTGNFYPETTDATGFVPINDSILNSWNVFNPQDKSVKDKFDLVKVDKNQAIPGGGTLAYDSYHIKTKKEFVYSSTSPSTDNYEFVFNLSSVASPDANTDFVQPNNRLRNVNPTILASDGDPNTELPTTFNINVSEQSIYEFKGVNGTISNVDGAKQVGLEWSIQGDTNNNFSIGADTGILFTTTDDVGGTFNLTVVLKDAGGQATHNVQIIADVLTDGDGVPNYEKVNDDVWCTNNISGESVANLGTIFLGKSLGEGVFITKNQQSAGYFWVSDPSNAQNNEPFDRSAGILNSLPATISADGDVVFQNMVNTECSAYTFSNANFTSKSNISTGYFGNASDFFWMPAFDQPYIGPIPGDQYTQTTNPNPNDFQTTNLKEGSMFVQVRHSSGQFNYVESIVGGYNNYYCNQGFSSDSIAKLGVPIVLQYRDTESPDYPNNWVTAIDIEGNECLFGGTQQASVQPRLTFSDTYNGTGVILNKDNSTLTIGDAVASVIPAQNISQVNFQLWKADSDRDLFTNAVDPEGIFLKGQPASEKVTTFVVGKDQIYFGDPKHGDYRLLIRYPFGTFPSPVSSNTNCGNNTSGLLTPTPTNCNEKIKNPVASKYRVPGVYLSYGDFYNPVGIDRACMENSGAFDLQNPISYAYKIGDINWESALEASYDDPVKEVYAREWHCKYVTRFYEDEKCTKLLNFTGYRSFSPLGSPVVGKIDTEATNWMPSQTLDLTFGYNRSDNSHAHGRGEEIIISPRDTDDDRRWIAEFKSGKKVKGTSKPSDFVSKDSSIQSREIVYGNGKIIKTSESLSTNSNTFEKEITGTLQVTAGQNINAPIKIGVSINKGSEGGPIPGSYGSTTGYLCTLGAQDVAETILSVESVGRIIIRSNKWPTPSDGECTTTVGFGGCLKCTNKMGTETQYSSNQTYVPNYEPENIEVEVNGQIIPIDEWGTKGFLTVPAGQIYSYSLVQRYTAKSNGTMVFATSTIFEL